MSGSLYCHIVFFSCLLILGGNTKVLEGCKSQTSVTLLKRLCYSSFLLCIKGYILSYFCFVLAVLFYKMLSVTWSGHFACSDLLVSLFSVFFLFCVFLQW